jgi:homeobox-leucine zipper protein
LKLSSQTGIRQAKLVPSSISGSTKGRSVIVQMADTLLTIYVGGIAGIPAEAWSIQCGQGKEEDVIKIMYKRKDDGTNTAIVCASTSFMLTVPMRRAFDLLKNNILRPKVR